MSKIFFLKICKEENWTENGNYQNINYTKMMKTGTEIKIDLFE